MGKILSFCVLTLITLAISRSANAQGNDFPPIGPGGEVGFPPRAVVGVPDFGGGVTQGRACRPIGIQNSMGDVIQVQFTLDWASLGALLNHFAMMTSGDAGDMHWIDGNGPGGQWRGWCISCTFQFTATTPNVTMWADFIGSDQFGCHLSVVAVIPHVPNTPLPQPVKDAAQHSKDQADWILAKLGWVDAICLAWWGNDAVCKISAIASAGLGYNSTSMGKLIADPPTDCYAQNNLRIPDVSELGVNANVADFIGDGVLPGYSWGILYYATFLKGYGDYAYDEANSASHCALIGDSNMYNWRAGNVRWAVGQYAMYAGAMAYHFRVLANEFYYHWNPETEWAWPCDASNWDYYNRRPDVAQDGYYGPGGPMGANGALQHFYDHGQYEGMGYNGTLCPATFHLHDVFNNAAYSLEVAASQLPF